MRIRFLLASALVALLPAVARGEVRIAGPIGAPSLEIRSSTVGPWTRLPGGGRRNLLNAEGDLTRDGRPSHDAVGRSLVAAWGRASTDDLVVTEVSESHDVGSELAVRVGPIIGTPRVHGLGDQALIVWQRADTSMIEAARWSSGSVSSVAPIVSATLLAVVDDGDSVFIVGLDASASMLVIVKLPMVIHPLPIPTDIFRIPLLHNSLPVSTGALRMPMILHPLPVPIEQGRALPIPVPINGRAYRAAATYPCIASDDRAATIAWRSDRHEIAVVRITEDGVTGPDLLDGPTGSCEAMLKAASR